MKTTSHSSTASLQTKSRIIIFDMECNGLTPDTIWVIVAKEYNGETFTFSYDKNNIEEGIKLLEQADTLIGHNIIGFDIPILNKMYDVDLLANKNIMDTLVMSRLYNPVREGGHSLKSWGYRVKVYKSEAPDSWDEFDHQMIPYCQQDITVNEATYNALLEESKGFTKESLEIEHEVTKILQQQEENGFYFNEQKGTELLVSLQQRMREVEDEVHEVFKPKWVDDKLVKPYIKKDGTLSKRGLTDEEYKKLYAHQMYKPFMRKKYQEFNLGSRKQIGEYLTDFGWKPNKFTPTGQPIVDESSLNKVKHIPEAKLIAEFLLLQKRTAQISSWLKELKGDRVHGRAMSIGTITGRMAHRNPNMAQVPSIKSPYGKECRSCWTVPQEYKLVGIDASGLEIRMLAHYMNDKEYTNEIINGDIHTRNQQTAGLQSRDQAKTFIYALMYGAGNEKLGKVVGGSKANGKQLRRRFFDNLPSFKTLRDSVERASKRTYLKGLDGRRIYVRYNYAALNTLLQGAGAVVMKKALMILDTNARSRNLDFKFVANVHDEWQVEVHEAHAEYFGKLGVEAIEQAGRHFKLRCPLTGTYKIGDNWYETH
jgi:DNA polymerase-1